MTTNTVLTEVDRRGFATVTLNRPDVNNAYNGEMILGLIDTLGVAAPILPQLNARIGLAEVRRYALTAERFDARRATEIGLVNEVCAAGKLDEAAAPRKSPP